MSLQYSTTVINGQKQGKFNEYLYSKNLLRDTSIEQIRETNQIKKTGKVVQSKI
mgnify:CR=1 FL=1